MHKARARAAAEVAAAETAAARGAAVEAAAENPEMESIQGAGDEGSSASTPGEEDDILLLDEGDDEGDGDFEEGPEGGAAEDGAEAGGAGGGGAAVGPTAFEEIETKPLDAKTVTKMKRELVCFMKKVKEYMTDAPTRDGKLLSVMFSESQSKLDPLAENARILLDVLQESTDPRILAGKPPAFYEEMFAMGMDPPAIEAATVSVATVMDRRDAVDSGRLMAYAETKTARRPAPGATGGGVGGGGEEPATGLAAAAEVPEGPATNIRVEFSQIDKNGHMDRTNRPPNSHTPEELQTIKSIVVAMLQGNWAKVNELIEGYGATYGTQGVRPQWLLSPRKTTAMLVDEGAFSFGEPGAGKATLTVQLAGGGGLDARAGPSPLPTTFSRTEQFKSEEKMFADMLAGAVKVPMGKRVGSVFTTALLGDSHRNLQARALLQERMVRGLITVCKRDIKYEDRLMLADVNALIRIYEAALDSTTGDAEARSLAIACEFWGPLSAAGIVISRGQFPYVNIASNFLAEFAATTSDPQGAHYLDQLSRLNQLRRKSGESVEGYFNRLELARQRLLQLPTPTDIDFVAMGFAVDPTSGIPTLISSPAAIIRMTVDYAFLQVPKRMQNSAIREVISEQIFKDARQGKLPMAALKAKFRELSQRNIDTVSVAETVEATAEDKSAQVSAFAAPKPTAQRPAAAAAAAGGGGGGKGGKGNGGGTGGNTAGTPDRGRQQKRDPADGKKGRGASLSLPRNHPSQTACYNQFVEFTTDKGLPTFLRVLNKRCVSAGEAVFVTDATGALVTPIKLAPAHTWGQYGGIFAKGGSNTDQDLFAGLMLARDICGNGSKLSSLGVKYSGFNKTWTKKTAVALRAGVPIDRTSVQQGQPTKGQTAAAAAAVSWCTDEDEEEE